MKNELMNDFFKPVGNEKVRVVISNQINQLIEEGKLKPNDKLPNEIELAKYFKVSRNTLRDALRILEAKELIEVRVGEGTFIKECPKEDLLQNLVEVLFKEKKLIEKYLEVREVLEPNIAYLAAKKVTKKDVDKIEKIIEMHEGKAEVGDPGIEEDILFHKTLVELTGNELLVYISNMINDEILNTREMMINYYKDDKKRYGHRKLLEALKKHSAEEAKKAMENHLREVREAYELGG